MNVPALFNLLPTSLMLFAYFNLNLAQANLTGYGQLRNMIDTSNYFKEIFPRNMRTNSAIDFTQANMMVRFASNEGHIIGNHSNKHKNEVKAVASGVDVLKEDLISLEKMYKELIGTDISSFMRPPEGVYSERTLAVIKDLGYRPVFWSFAYRDWETDKQPTEKEAMDKIMGQIHPGSVLLLHTVSKTNTDILGNLIDNIRDRGYRIGSLNEL